MKKQEMQEMLDGVFGRILEFYDLMDENLNKEGITENDKVFCKLLQEICCGFIAHDLDYILGSELRSKHKKATEKMLQVSLHPFLTQLSKMMGEKGKDV